VLLPIDLRTTISLIGWGPCWAAARLIDCLGLLNKQQPGRQELVTNTMGSFLFSTLFDLITGSAKQRLDAAEAFEAPPANPVAQRYRTIAFCFFMATSALLLSAALVDWFFNMRLVGEILGWSGIVCLHVCVICGIRYAVVNGATSDDATSRI